MPSLGADMDAGTLIAWHVKPGDFVKRGDVVADVETDKGIVEVEIWESGVVDALAVAPGTKVPVGTVLATTSGTRATTTASSVASPAKSEPAAPAVPAPSVSSPPPIATPSTRVLASPAAKQLARELGVDLASIHGTGPHGSVTRSDVASAPKTAPEQAVAEAPAQARATATPAVSPAAKAPSTLDAAAMRRAIAATMARSKREIPHYYLSADLDVEDAVQWLTAHNATRSVTERILFAALLLKATALAVRDVPEMNGFFVDGAYRAATAVHLGVAVSLRQGGLVAPAIHDVAEKSLADVQESLRDLVARVRAGRLRSSEMSDPTLTVTNLGDQGVDSVFGVIYPPQVALVGFGRVGERAWASGGMVGARSVVTATLSADHRVSDGHRGALFLAAIGRALKEPEKL